LIDTHKRRGHVKAVKEVTGTNLREALCYETRSASCRKQ